MLKNGILGTPLIPCSLYLNQTNTYIYVKHERQPITCHPLGLEGVPEYVLFTRRVRRSRVRLSVQIKIMEPQI